MAKINNMNMEKYLRALREAVGEDKFPIAKAQLRALDGVLSRERRRELEAGADNNVRRGLLDGWYGGFLSDEVKNLAVILAEKKELSLLGEISNAEESGDRAVVITAKNVSEETRGWLREELKAVCGASGVDFREDKGIIGGVKIKIGSREVDATIKGRLASLTT